MIMEQDLSFRPIKNETEQTIIFDQYKILLESINKLNEMRENSNQFWIGLNGLGISFLSYWQDSQSAHQHHKSFLIAIFIVGMLFCSVWLSYLWTIKKRIGIRNDILMNLEKNFPLPVFSRVFSLSEEKKGKTSLTVKEMLVPCLFMAGYGFFIILLFFFPQEVLPIDIKNYTLPVTFLTDNILNSLKGCLYGL
jgi:hypothetical protein